jgi:hypothetical protein
LLSRALVLDSIATNGQIFLLARASRGIAPALFSLCDLRMSAYRRSSE